MRGVGAGIAGRGGGRCWGTGDGAGRDGAGAGTVLGQEGDTFSEALLQPVAPEQLMLSFRPLQEGWAFPPSSGPRPTEGPLLLGRALACGRTLV